MGNPAIHRLIEQQAARLADSVALVDGECSLTYRDLNQRANARARLLIDHGLRRGSVAVVKMERSAELAVTLLAVLKAGGAYTWLDRDEDASWPRGLSIVLDEAGDDEGAGQRCLAVDIARDVPPSAPNLPIVSRASDVACVLRDNNGGPAVLVSHEVITALHAQPVPSAAPWANEPGALDLWSTLMSGSTAVLCADRMQSAAA